MAEKVKWLDKAIKIYPNYIEAYLRKAEVIADISPVQSFLLINKALEIDPRSSSTLRCWAWF